MRGVEYSMRGETRQALASSEVILCGGAINTPQLLMLSGIGPSAHLAEFGIRALADLPVGQGLQDHPGVFMNWARRGGSPFRPAAELSLTNRDVLTTPLLPDAQLPLTTIFRE